MDEKTLALYIFELEDDTPKQYQITNSKIPNENCISVKVSLKESLQVDKLKIIFDGIIPKVEHKEELNDVEETEFGYQLIIK